MLYVAYITVGGDSHFLDCSRLTFALSITKEHLPDVLTVKSQVTELVRRAAARSDTSVHSEVEARSENFISFIDILNLTFSLISLCFIGNWKIFILACWLISKFTAWWKRYQFKNIFWRKRVTVIWSILSNQLLNVLFIYCLIYATNDHFLDRLLIQ